MEITLMSSTDSFEDLRVYKTTDFSKFSFLDENRKVNIEYAKSLRKKIEKHGFDKKSPIIVVAKGNKFAITAGQHRFTACKGTEEEEGIGFYYTVIPKEEVDQSVMSDHNGGFRDWSDRERLHRFVTKKDPNYRKLHDLIRSYPEFMNVANGLLLIFGLDTKTGNPRIKNAKKMFVEGDLKVSNRQLKAAMESAETISQIIDRREEDHSIQAKRSTFIRALFLLISHEKFDARKFDKAISKSNSGLIALTNWKDTLEDMLMIYNGNARAGKKLEFKTIEESITNSRKRAKRKEHLKNRK